MSIDSHDPLALPGALRGQLKAKGRRRRENLSRLAQAATPSRPTRNDLLPPLELVIIPLDELKVSGRAVRKLDPAHIREVADSIGDSSFCDPLLIGKGNAVIDGLVRLERS